MFDIKMTLFAVLIIPRIYMLDWSLTTTEFRKHFFDSSEYVVQILEDLDEDIIEE